VYDGGFLVCVCMCVCVGVWVWLFDFVCVWGVEVVKGEEGGGEDVTDLDLG